MAGLPGIIVKITADVKDALQGLNRVENAVGQPMGAFDKFGKVAVAAGAAIAGAFALDKVISFFQESAAAAMEDEKSLVALAVAMDNVGLAAENANVEAFIKKLSLARGVADDELRPALQRIITVTGDVATAQNALALAMDISAGSGRDLDSVSTALAKAYGGQTTALGRLGVGLDSALLKSKDMDAITAALAAKFQGQSAAAAETYTGKINRLNVAVQEAKETIGYELISALDTASQSLGGVGGFSAFIERAAENAADLIAGVGQLVIRMDNLRYALARQGTPADTFLTTLGNILSEIGKYAGTFGPAIVYTEKLGKAQREARGAMSSTTQAAIDAGKAMGTTLTPETYDAADAADKAAKSYLSLWESIWNVRRAAADLANTSGTVTSALAEGAKTGGVADYWKKVSVAYGETEKSVRSAGSAASESSKGFGELGTKFQETFSDAMRERITSLTDALATQLQAAKEKAQSFASNMQNTILSGFGIGKAYDAALNEEGKLNATAWIDGVDQMVAKWEWFGNVLQAVRGSGNDAGRQALAEYLAKEGADKGGVMGQALIDNGLIQTMADKMQTVRDQAAVVAQNMVPEYLLAGIDSAQATYDGFKAAAGKGGPVYNALMNLMDNLANAMRRETTVTVTTINRQINEVIESFGYGGPRAMGGPVSSGRAYVVGEVGPELFVPGRSGTIVPNSSMGGNTYNISVSTGVGDPRMIGEQIVSYVKRFEQASGAVWAAA